MGEVIINGFEGCPKCKVSWIGTPIPHASREHYGGNTHFKREVGIYDMNRDMTVAWECPDCKTRFDRWTMKEIQTTEGKKN